MTKSPSIISAMPSHEEGESISPMKNTPSNEAVSGSAKDSVTAASASDLRRCIHDQRHLADAAIMAVRYLVDIDP